MSHESNFVSKYLQAILLSFYIKYARKKCWENFLRVFFGCPYCSNGTKTCQMWHMPEVTH